MAAADQLVNDANGVDGGGKALDWRWVRVRARTVFGNLSKLPPFNWPNRTYAATVSEYDAVTGTAEQVAFRYVDSRQDASDSPNNCVCFKDMVLVWWEHFLATTPPKEVEEAIKRAGVLRKWPTNYPGTPPYEKGS